MRPQDDPEEQQPDHLREPDATGKRRNADDDRDGDSELRQGRQRQHLRPQCIEQFHRALDKSSS